MRFRHYKYYIFVSELNETIKKNILKISKPNLILNFNISEESSLILAKSIIKFCKKHHISFYILNDIKIAKQLNARGVFISATNKKIGLSLFNSVKFKLIGSAHNQNEYFIKYQQRCETIMLSPIFYNNKYSVNKILNTIKFNLIAQHWSVNLCALGGISDQNIKKINMTKAGAIAIKSFISAREK
jgi:thiamine monophosphate synthase